jgi:hypothetical protein
MCELGGGGYTDFAVRGRKGEDSYVHSVCKASVHLILGLLSLERVWQPRNRGSCPEKNKNSFNVIRTNSGTPITSFLVSECIFFYGLRRSGRES